MFTTQVALLNAVTEDKTGDTFEVGMRSKISVQFIASGVTSGNGVFTIEVSNDGINWVQYNRLNDNLANSNTQGDTRVASCTLNSNTNKIYFFPEGDHFRYVRAKVDVTTDGTYSALLHAVS
jgi:hypothetical protein